MTEIVSSEVLGDLCNPRGGDIAAAERHRLAVEAPAMHDASGLRALLASPAPEMRGKDDSELLRAGSEHQAPGGRMQLEAPGYADARVDL